MKTSIMIAMSGFAVLAVTSASAAPAQDSGWYAGFNVGTSKAKIDDARITSGLLSDGFSTVSITEDNSHLGYKLFAGYDFNR